MASGNFISATGVNLNVYVVWSSTINVEGNYSTVYMDIYLRHYSLTCSAKSGSGTADGSSQGFSTPAYSFGNYLVDTLMASKSFIVYHNPDGTKSCGLSAYWGFVGTYGGQSINGITAAATVTLDTIPRKSSISSLTPTVEANGSNPVVVGISRASASFTHTVTFYFGAYSQQYTGVATSQSFTIPMSWLNAIPNSVSGAALCRVETFSGGVSLGYVDGYFTINVPLTVIPVVEDITFARDTTGTDPFTTFAKGISKVSISGISVTNQYSATNAVLNTYLHLAANAYTTGLLITGLAISPVIPWSGAMRLTTIATDSRGRVSAPYFEDFTVYDYFAPSLTVNAFRCNLAGVADPAGEYLSATMDVNVAPVNNNNTKTYLLEYKKTTDSTWSPISTAALTGYSGTLNAVRAAASTNSWEVRATITDKANTAAKVTSVTSKRVGINVNPALNSVAIGKMAEAADLFEVDLAAKFNKSVSLPIGADKYYPATAGANGDFYVTLLGTLATNHIVYISFPTATNGASNARLSVDGGTTYKNIKWVNIRLASEVASQKLSFVYDGTDFVPLQTEFFPIDYTPTVTTQTGTLTSTITYAKYVKVGRKVTVNYFISITNKGTGSGLLYVSVPFISKSYCSPSAYSLTGAAVIGGYLVNNNTSITLLGYAGGSIIASGLEFVLEVTYFTD